MLSNGLSLTFDVIRTGFMKNFLELMTIALSQKAAD